MSTTADLIAQEYASSRNYFLGVANRYCRNSQDSEDMVSMGFLRALGAVAQYSGPAPLKAWLAIIVRNVCLDQARRVKARPEGYADPIDVVDWERLSEDPIAERGLMWQQKMKEVRLAIKRLPVQERAALEEYLRTGEVGSNNTFKVQKYRAIQHLREMLVERPARRSMAAAA